MSDDNGERIARLEAKHDGHERRVVELERRMSWFTWGGLGLLGKIILDKIGVTL